MEEPYKKIKTLPAIRTTTEDYDVVASAAIKRGRTVTDWVRWCAIEASRRVMGIK